MRKSRLNAKTMVGLIVVLGMIGIITGIIPLQMGMVGVIQELIRAICFSIVLILLIMILIKEDCKVKRIRKGNLLLYIVFLIGVLLFANRIIEAILAVEEGPQSVVSNDYEVDFHTTYGAHSSYILKINCSDGSRRNVYMSKEYYYELRGSNKAIKVAYYPYIDIVEEISCINH